MTGMHHMLAHFPVGFWALATLMILVGALAAIVTGFLVWPLEASTHSPLARNHILMALWSLGGFAMLTVLVWRAGSAAFDGARRWVLVILALIGGLFFAAAGTLGGHLAGASTAFSDVLGLMGWEVYTTFYSPFWVSAVMGLIGIACAVVGLKGRRAAS